METDVTTRRQLTGREVRAVRAADRIRITDLARAAGISRKTAWALERSDSLTTPAARRYLQALDAAVAGR